MNFSGILFYLFHKDYSVLHKDALIYPAISRRPSMGYAETLKKSEYPLFLSLHFE